MVEIFLFFHIFKKLQQTWLQVMLTITQLTECGKLEVRFAKVKLI